jgi:hypothetical protein
MQLFYTQLVEAEQDRLEEQRERLKNWLEEQDGGSDPHTEEPKEP